MNDIAHLDITNDDLRLSFVNEAKIEPGWSEANPRYLADFELLLFSEAFNPITKTVTGGAALRDALGIGKTSAAKRIASWWSGDHPLLSNNINPNWMTPAEYDVFPPRRNAETSMTRERSRTSQNRKDAARAARIERGELAKSFLSSAESALGGVVFRGRDEVIEMLTKHPPERGEHLLEQALQPGVKRRLAYFRASVLNPDSEWSDVALADECEPMGEPMGEPMADECEPMGEPMVNRWLPRKEGTPRKEEGEQKTGVGNEGVSAHLSKTTVENNNEKPTAGVAPPADRPLWMSDAEHARFMAAGAESAKNDNQAQRAEGA